MRIARIFAQMTLKSAIIAIGEDGPAMQPEYRSKARA